MNRKPFLLSHNDLDGYGCNLSANQVFENLRYMNVGYDKITEYLDYILSILPELTEVYITDLNFKKEHFIQLYKMVKHNDDIKFYFLDHHPIEDDASRLLIEKLKEFPNFKFVHSEKYCATYIFFQYLKKQEGFQPTEEFTKIIELIDTFDMWRTESDKFKGAMALNDVFNDRWGEKFLALMVKSNYIITDEIKSKMKELVQQKNLFFKEALESKKIIPFDDVLLVMCDNFIPYINIDFPDYKFWVNGRTYGKLSVRIHPDVDYAKELKNHLAENLIQQPEVISAGGHDYAFGITLQNKSIPDMVRIAQYTIKEIFNFKKMYNK